MCEQIKNSSKKTTNKEYRILYFAFRLFDLMVSTFGFRFVSTSGMYQQKIVTQFLYYSIFILFGQKVIGLVFESAFIHLSLKSHLVEYPKVEIIYLYRYKNILQTALRFDLKPNSYQE